MCKEYTNVCSFPHAKERKRPICLQLEGEAKTFVFDVRLKVRRLSELKSITKGWGAFAKKYKMKEGDICLVQRDINSRRLMFKIYLIRSCLVHQNINSRWLMFKIYLIRSE